MRLGFNFQDLHPMQYLRNFRISTGRGIEGNPIYNYQNQTTSVLIPHLREEFNAH